VQRFWSILFGITMAGAFLLFVVAPFVGWWLPRNVATFGPGIDWLFYLILAITGIFFVLTEVLLVWFLFRYTGAPGRRALYTHGHHKLEIFWSIVPGVILLVLAIVQINVWAEVKFQKNMPRPNGTTQQMEVTAQQWEWLVRYPNRDRMASWEKEENRALDFGQTPHVDDVHLANEIHVWNGARVLVHLKTRDVIHSFFLPNLRLKQDALPGKTIPVWFATTDYNCERQDDPLHPGYSRWVEKGYDPKTGKVGDPSMIWELACAEFCGTRHSMMRGKLYVHKDRADYLEWLRQAESKQNLHQPASTTPLAARSMPAPVSGVEIGFLDHGKLGFQSRNRVALPR
jgi:cytochrome c oxidase subunit II